MLKGFKDFVLRGNVIDLSVAVVIGAAFSGVVTAFTEKIIKPLLAAVTPPTTQGFGPTLIPSKPSTLIDFGSLITALINFLLVATVVYFVIVLPMKTLKDRRKRGEKTGPTEPTDVELLKEIRDLLKAQAGGRADAGPSHDEPAQAPGTEAITPLVGEEPELFTQPARSAERMPLGMAHLAGRTSDSGAVSAAPVSAAPVSESPLPPAQPSGLVGSPELTQAPTVDLGERSGPDPAATYPVGSVGEWRQVGPLGGRPDGARQTPGPSSDDEYAGGQAAIDAERYGQGGRHSGPRPPER